MCVRERQLLPANSVARCGSRSNDSVPTFPALQPQAIACVSSHPFGRPLHENYMRSTSNVRCFARAGCMPSLPVQDLPCAAPSMHHNHSKRLARAAGDGNHAELVMAGWVVSWQWPLLSAAASDSLAAAACIVKKGQYHAMVERNYERKTCRARAHKQEPEKSAQNPSPNGTPIRVARCAQRFPKRRDNGASTHRTRKRPRDVSPNPPCLLLWGLIIVAKPVHATAGTACGCGNVHGTSRI